MASFSRDIARGRTLVPGNEILFGQHPDYDRQGRRPIPGYTVGAIMQALGGMGASAPPGHPDRDACSVFAGYLLLDAVVGNTDRHHENWGVLATPDGSAPPALAATFDHASSLGFQLSDEERRERLATRDLQRTVQAYAERGCNRHFAGGRHLLELAVAGFDHCARPERAMYTERLLAPDEVAIANIVSGIPQGRWSSEAATFAQALITINRGRLLDALDHPV